MRNKRGSFLALYLVVLTVFMCGLSILIYLAQQDDVHSSLVSPKVVLETRDDLELFERREIDLISESLIAADEKFDFGNEEFLKEFRKIFLDKSFKDSEFSGFISSGVFVGGRDLSEEKVDWKSFFENILYPEDSFKYEDGDLFFSRARVSKSYFLKAENQKNVNFDMGFSYSFDEDFAISFDKEKYTIHHLR